MRRMPKDAKDTATLRARQAAILSGVGTGEQPARVRWSGAETEEQLRARVRRIQAKRKSRVIQARNPTHRAARILDEET